MNSPKKMEKTPGGCFFCIMKEQDPTIRKPKLRAFFKAMNSLVQDQELVVVLSGIWSIAMANPNDGELQAAGVLKCMAELIKKALENADWLMRDQNIYVPYYAAHIIGSYTMNNAASAARAADSGVVPPLVALLRGKMTWVEQRVAVRALGHLASYEKTFESVAIFEQEIVELAVDLASTCLETVYNEFVNIKDRAKKAKLKYQRDLVTRGIGGLEMENRKAEEWASQLQCWSLHLLNCFAVKERSLDLICTPKFLRDLSGMWGGLMNHSSPGGIGLIRVLCYNKFGRKCISESPETLKTLCNLSRSSDDWQYMGIDCLLLLLSDVDTRYKVLETSALCLVDLVELRTLRGRLNLGETITRLLLSDFKKIRSRKVKILKNSEAERALEELWGLKVERRKREQSMSEEKLDEKRVMSTLMKQQGHHSFNLGKFSEALIAYTEALEFCPLKHRKERSVLYSNRAQCRLLIGEIDGAISDTTRALCLSNPPNSHAKSLWRRSQAYDMKGMAKQSLMDCIMFISTCFKSESAANSKKGVKIIPYYAVRMITKQMDSTWLFSNCNGTQKHNSIGDNVDDNNKSKSKTRNCRQKASRIAHYLEESCNG
nr:ARM-repeat/Tetratricopeptide repeat-like protein [Ipomoea batatas]GMD99450.1 ARM-repeat/Tetratricopeptide repeat-like protein [Ipomoea batatas]GMD99451.1 ARM-repeat/Tetratricopeptide repeat-like protein [Ipomoea batatas]